jgi:hypothetical protein
MAVTMALGPAGYPNFAGIAGSRRFLQTPAAISAPTRPEILELVAHTIVDAGGRSVNVERRRSNSAAVLPADRAR